MKTLSILTLNCQRGYHQKLRRKLSTFLTDICLGNIYEYILLQEMTPEVFSLAIQAAGTNYSVLTSTHPSLRIPVQKSILHRTPNKPIQTSFIPVPQYDLRPPHHEFGMTIGVFNSHNTIVGSFHLYAGLNPRIRHKQLRLLKQYLLKVKQDYPEYNFIIGGDTNSLVPGSFRSDTNTMKPEFISVTGVGQKTLNTARAEPTWLLGRLAYGLGKLGVNIRLNADRIFFSGGDILMKHDSEVLKHAHVSDHDPLATTLYFSH